MRVIGYLQRPGLKVTVFKMDTRISIKFENGYFEQTYKFRITEYLSSVAAIDELVDEAFLRTVQERFATMQHDFNQAMEKVIPPATGEELPEIM